MKKQFIILSALVLLMTSLTGCAIVESIFKAGMIWAFFLVALVVGGIIYLMSRRGRK